MSLGPPFDHSGERLRLILGAATGVTLLVAIGVALLAADRSLGEAVTVHMLVQRPGALHTGALVRVAGEQIGEVVAIRGHRPEAGLRDGPGAVESAEPGVDIELRLRKRWASRIYDNSTFLPVNPTVLAEALIEIGPPAGGAAPGSPIGAEQRVRGVEPADLDQLLRRVYQSIELTLQQARELGAEWTELNEAFTALSARLSVSLPDTLRVQVQGAAARQGIEQLLGTLRAGRADELPELTRQLDRSLTPLVRQFQLLGAQGELLQARARELGQALGPGQQAELRRAIAQLRTALSAGEQLAADARFLIRYVDSGRGTLGGFSQDMQIFDELKDTSRILKQQSWRLLIKRRDSAAPAAPVAPAGPPGRAPARPSP